MKSTSALVTAVITLSLTACTTNDAEEETAAPPDYSEVGPWSVGNLSVEIESSGGLILEAEVWFPSDGTGTIPRFYEVISWDLPGIAYTDLEASCESPLPVLIHSHGNGSLPIEMFEVHEHVASHGWLVLSPGHTENTLFDNMQQTEELMVRRPQDIRDVFDWAVAQSTDPESPLYGCVDEAAGYANSGYSFGGYTAFANGGALVASDDDSEAADLSDPRVTAIVPLAPWDAFGSLTEGSSAVEVPSLIIGGERDDTVGTAYIDLFENISLAPSRLASFPDAGHYSFVPIFCPVLNTDGCGDDYVDYDYFVGFMKSSITTFLEEQRGVEGAEEQYPEEDGLFSWSGE